MGDGLKVYSLPDSSFSFALVPCDSGRGDDEFVSYKQQADDYVYTAGSDGEGTFSLNVNRYTELTLTIQQTSSYNDVLSAARAVGLATPGGMAPAPLRFKDGQGTTVVAGLAVILGPPEQKRGKKAGMNQWRFGIHQPQRVDGGT